MRIIDTAEEVRRYLTRGACSPEQYEKLTQLIANRDALLLAETGKGFILSSAASVEKDKKESEAKPFIATAGEGEGQAARDANILSITIPSWPPRELWPNYAKPGPGWTVRGWQGRLAQVKQQYGGMVYIYALNAVRERGWEAPERCRLILICLNTQNRWPDSDGVAAAFKCGRDTLVKAGVFRNDGPGCVTELVLRHERHPSIKGIRVEIEAVE